MRTIGAGVTDAAFVTEFDSVDPWVQMAPIWIVTSAASGTGTLTMTAELYLNDVLVETRSGMVHTPTATGTFFRMGPRSPSESFNAAFSSISIHPNLSELFATKRMVIKLKVTANTRTTSTTLNVYVQGYRTRPDHIFREYTSFQMVSGSASAQVGSWGLNVSRLLFAAIGPGRLFGLTTARVDNQGANDSVKQAELYINGSLIETLTLGGNTYQTAFGFRSDTYVANIVDTLNQPPILWSPSAVFEGSLSMEARLTVVGSFPTAILEVFGAAFVGLY